MSPVPPSLERFGDELHHAACRELSPESEPTRPHRRLLRRPRALAGGSLGLAGVAAALVVALSAGGATAPPAFAVTRAQDGSVLVHLSSPEGVPGAEHELASMGIDEYAGIAIQYGAQAAEPVTCSPVPGGSAPTVRVVMDSGVVPQGQTGAGSWHLVGCYMHAGTFPGIQGNTGPGTGGAGNSGATGTGTGNSGS